MSCNWNVYCVDCSENAGMSVNHGEATMRLLVDRRAVLELLGHTFTDGKSLGSAWDLTLMLDGVNIDVSFFLRHREHNIRPRNEYGEFDAPCGGIFDCPFCGPVACGRKDHSIAFNSLHGHSHGLQGYHWQKEK